MNTTFRASPFYKKVGARVLSQTTHLTTYLSYRQYPIRPFGAPSPRVEGCVSGIPLSPSNLRPFGAPPSKGRREHPREPLPLEGAAERSEAGLASFFAAKPPPLYLPHWGRSGARVLSYIAYLRRSPSLSFIPLVPYPPLRGTFPSRGRLCVGDTAFPLQPPPLRGTSFQRKEGASTRAPSLGRGCRAQRGGVGFLFCGEAASSLPSPLL